MAHEDGRNRHTSSVPRRRTSFSGLLAAGFAASAFALSSCGGTDGASRASASGSEAAAIEPLPKLKQQGNGPSSVAAGHVFMVVAGVRFDTSGTRKDGSRWQKDMRPTSGYVARHPPGL